MIEYVPGNYEKYTRLVKRSNPFAREGKPTFPGIATKNKNPTGKNQLPGKRHHGRRIRFRL